MADQSKSQKDTVQRVMHDFKEGELETSTGKLVTSRRQAIAIGLSEAGASNAQPADENKRASRTGGRSHDEGGRSKADLYDEAKQKNVAGRSRMSKAELGKAVG